jgi:rhodanese-related sulfurtransferase
MNKTMTCHELQQLIGEGAVVLVDVLTPEDYERAHIAGAHSACVYEMVFLDRIAECAQKRDTPLVVYDATGLTQAAETARDKLSQAGYTTVSVLAGGLAAWRAAGFPVEGTAAAETVQPTLQDGQFPIDAGKSAVEWIGRNINNRHYGRIAVAGGQLTVRNGSLAGGRIELDMSAITNSDLQDANWREMLIRHLISDDFFAVERYPAASFVLTGWEPITGATPGTPNGIVTGDLTIKGTTRPVSFPALVAPQEDGSIKCHAAFDIDRTLWGVCYGSGRLFERLGMHLVHDLISIELFIVAQKD